jgi:hypothetical protein
MEVSKEVFGMTLTKLEMIQYIERSRMVVNFSTTYFLKKSRTEVEKFYKEAQEFNRKKLLTNR